MKCQQRYLWLLLWGRWFLWATLFALSQSGFIAGAAMPGTLHNPSLLWPLTSGHWYSESATIFDIYTHVPFLVSFLLIVSPFYPREMSTNKISPQVCSFECHTSRYYATLYNFFNALVIVVTKLWVVKVLRFRFPCDCVRRATVMRMTLRCPLASREAGQLIG